LHSFDQLVFDLLGEVLAELLAVQLHPLSLNVHLGVPAKGMRHLQEYLLVLLRVGVCLGLLKVRVILVPRLLH